MQSHRHTFAPRRDDRRIEAQRKGNTIQIRLFGLRSRHPQMPVSSVRAASEDAHSAYLNGIERKGD